MADTSPRVLVTIDDTEGNRDEHAFSARTFTKVLLQGGETHIYAAVDSMGRCEITVCQGGATVLDTSFGPTNGPATASIGAERVA